MSHIWMRHVPRMNESCPTCEWVMSHMWMSHVPHMNESCPMYEWGMSHMNTSHPTPEWVMFHMSCPTYEWVMSHIPMSHVPHTSESCPTSKWVLSRRWMSHVTLKSDSSLDRDVRGRDSTFPVLNFFLDNYIRSQSNLYVSIFLIFGSNVSAVSE